MVFITCSSMIVSLFNVQSEIRCEWTVCQACVWIGQIKYNTLQAKAALCETWSHVAIIFHFNIKLRVYGPDTWSGV